jgi:hypothetical protein
MRFSRWIWFCLLPLALVAARRGPGIVIDGRFGDWDRVPVAARVDGEGSGPCDVRELRLAQDSAGIYLLFDCGQEVTLQQMAGTLSLLFDADGDPETGTTLHGLPGTDVVVDFSPRGQAGTTIRNTLAPTEVRTADAVALAFEPTHAAARYEIRIGRGGVLSGLAPLFTGKRVTVMAVSTDEDGTVGDSVGPATLRLDDFEPIQLNGRQDPLARAPNTAFRALSWNVARGLVTRPDAFLRVIAALAPDLLLLDEAPELPSVEPLKSFFLRLPTHPDAPPWNLIYGGGGGYQRGLLASREPLQGVDAFRRIEYPAPASSQLRQVLSDPKRIEREQLIATQGLAVSAGAVMLQGRRLLAVSVDLQCCGTPNSFDDRKRNLEAELIRDAVRAALAKERFDGVIIAGDFNLVASRSALETLTEGLDLDGSALAVAEPLQLDGLTVATVDSPGARFAPGRLDFQLYSDSTLEVARTFVLDARDLSPRWLLRHNLQGSDQRASDHLPIVTDYRWKARRSR